MQKRMLSLGFALIICSTITVSATSDRIVKNFDSLKEITEEATEDRKTAPFYSLEKTDHGYVVTYKEMLEVEKSIA